jgi:hypothetical protein
MVVLRILALLLLSSLAHADNLVLSCPFVWGGSTYCGGCSGPTWVKPAKGLTVRPHVLDRWTNIDTLKPEDFVSVSTTAAEGSLGQCSQITGALKVSDLLAPVAPATPFVPVAYVCTPKLSLWEYRGDYVGSAGAVTWYCDTPTEIRKYAFCGDPAKLPWTIVKTGLAAIGAAVKSSQVRACTEAEATIAERLHATEGPKITVAPNGTALTRPVYPATANNTRGTTKVGDIKIIGDDGKPTPCGFKRLQNTDGTGSMYFEVTGGFSMCKITGAVSK